MRIGVFTDSYKPYISGVVNSIDTFTRELRLKGHDIYIFAPRYAHYEDKEKGIFRFSSVKAPSNPDFSLAIPFSLKFGPTLRKLGLDLIHVHSPFIMGQVGAVQARRLDIPLIFTYHTLYEQYVHYVPFNPKLTREVMVRLSRYFCNQCDTVITPSQKIKDLLISYGVQTNIEIIPTGIDNIRFSQGDNRWLRNKYYIDSTQKILLFVGRLTREKNVDFLIRAFSLVNNKFPDTILVIVARGPEEDHLKRLVYNLGLSNKVIFTGHLLDQELINCYHGADIFTFPSVTETQGLVILEAMAAGLPVVAIDAYGVSDMVESGINGILTDYSIEAFSEGISQVLSDENKRINLGKNALKHVEEMSSSRMALKLENVYFDAITNKQKFSNKNIRMG